MEGGGFEPPKVEPADLQSAPFDHSGTPPKIKPRILRERNATVNRNKLIRHKKTGAGGRNRTPDLLITNQLLYQLSYTSIYIQILHHWHPDSCPRFASADSDPASCRSFAGLRIPTGRPVPPYPKSDDSLSINNRPPGILRYARYKAGDFRGWGLLKQPIELTFDNIPGQQTSRPAQLQVRLNRCDKFSR